jgi:SAM-dependent methyltransferase
MGDHGRMGRDWERCGWGLAGRGKNYPPPPSIEKKRVDFDEYVDQYENLLQEQLSFFSKDRGYFSEYKVELARQNITASPARVLDFGCGIGLSLYFLANYFSGARIFATDLSQKSLAYVHEKYPYVSTVQDKHLEEHSFDMIFMTGVMHHVPPECRADLVKRLSSLLADDGQLCIFDHNPYNPVTRHIVSTCPFDEDAALVSMRGMKTLLTSQGNFRIEKAEYCLFFPESLQALRPLERFLGWFPMGGQYYVLARR